MDLMAVQRHLCTEAPYISAVTDSSVSTPQHSIANQHSAFHSQQCNSPRSRNLDDSILRSSEHYQASKRVKTTSSFRHPQPKEATSYVFSTRRDAPLPLSQLSDLTLLPYTPHLTSFLSTQDVGSILSFWHLPTRTSSRWPPKSGVPAS